MCIFKDGNVYGSKRQLCSTQTVSSPSVKNLPANISGVVDIFVPMLHLTLLTAKNAG